MRRRPVGIDLGTTNSVVAVLEAGVPVIIPTVEGSRLTPSVVAFARDGEVLVGEVAKRQAITNPDRTVRSVKRRMGTGLKISVGGRAYSPQEISAYVLKKLKRDAEAYLGEEVSQAVITVPAFFDDAQRTATSGAGTLAGLKVLRIIHEPTAAALAYGLGRTKHETVLVFDLGGGSLDVAILNINGARFFDVRTTRCDIQLGGDDWDQRIIDWLVKQFQAAHSVDLSADNMAVQRLKEAAEKAKIELSQVQQTQISLPFITATHEGPLHLDESLSRTKFQELTADLLERCHGPFENALKDVGLTREKIDQVVLVGGMTRVPAVQDVVHKLAGKDGCKRVSPDEVVAAGAAIQAGMITGDVSHVVLLDVTPLSLGIETKGGVMTKLIERNTTIPTRRTEVFTTADDMQPSVEIHVLQGEREMAAFNQSLGKFQIVDLPPAPRGVPQIEVTFDIDANGIVHVSAKDRATGKEQSMTAGGQFSVRKDEFDQMTDDDGPLVEEDRRRRRETEARNEADTLRYQAEKLLHEQGDKLPASARLAVRTALAAQKKTLDGTDIDAIKDATETLATTSRAFQEMLADAAPSQDASTAVGASWADRSEQPHAFISYVRENAQQVDRIQAKLEANGIRTWRDTDELWPGEDWKSKIREAITDNALVFIACFSDESLARPTTYQNEEMIVAIDQLRLRRLDQPWLIPIRLSDCRIPRIDIGAGRLLPSLQWVDLFGSKWDSGLDRLVIAVRRIMDMLDREPL